MRKFLHGILAVVIITAGYGLSAEGSSIDPEQYLKQRLSLPALRTTSGEQFTWHYLFAAYDFLYGYEAFNKDTKWLDAAIKYYDTCIKKGVSNDPDGYPGTIGAGIGQKLSEKETVLLTDCVVGDANMMQAPLLFADMVYSDPKLKANPKYKNKADEYIKLAEKMCWEKWNKRGGYYEDGHGFGSYHTYPYGIDRNNRSKWVPSAPIVSDNLNKHYKMGLVMLRLWRITGKPEYRDRVIAIYGRLKSMFRYYKDDDRVVWNFWMPHGKYDLEGTAPRSWVAVHPHRPGYQAFECGAILEVYDSGLVFDKKDMERVVRTNLWMMNNGYQNADGTAKAGTVWSKLARLDDRIYNESLKKSRNAVYTAYLKAEKAKGIGYKRKYLKDESKAMVSNVPLQPGEKLSMAQAIPDVVQTANSDRIKLIACIRESGDIKIELLDSKGRSLGELESKSLSKNDGAYHTILWDGTNPKTGKKDIGEYLVRWTLNGESRTTPVTVKVGKKSKDNDSVKELAAGESLVYDFEKPLDGRWVIQGAAISTEKAKSGKSSLKIGHRQSAVLKFGEVENLPAKIEYWLYDGGAKVGKSNGEGPGWGVQMANGNKFALFMKWRKYLNGDKELYWLNNGENQWFSPHRTGLTRTPGWNHYVMDFSGDTVEISKDGKVLNKRYATPEKFIPKGATAVLFMGTSLKGKAGDASTLYVDDLKITRK